MVGRSRAAERSGACGAVAEQEIGDGVSGELAVESEAAARRHLGEVLELAELRLQAEPDVVAALHLARRVRDAVDVLCGTLRDPAFAVPAESRHREARTTVVDRIDPASQILQADVGDPVASVRG